jgi:ABC-type sulfate/molybdate transport systems ATPase subunit
MMPMLVDRGFPNTAMAAQADELISLVGLQNVKHNLALNMSGAQQSASPWPARWR